MAGSNWPTVEAQPANNPDSLDIGHCAIDVYNVERELWKNVPKAKLIEYYHSNNEATLLWMINLGCIDINPWNSRTQCPEEPDPKETFLEITFKAVSDTHYKQGQEIAQAEIAL